MITYLIPLILAQRMQVPELTDLRPPLPLHITQSALLPSIPHESNQRNSSNRGKSFAHRIRHDNIQPPQLRISLLDHPLTVRKDAHILATAPLHQPSVPSQ